MMIRFAGCSTLRVVPYETVERAVEAQVKQGGKVLIPVEKTHLYFVTEGIHGGWPPNDNGDLFPEEELFGLSLMGGKVSETWIGKPVLENHEQNRRLGSIVDTHEVEERKSVDMLDTIDRNKHPLIAKDIEDGRITDTSMGVIVQKGVCSVCDNVAYDESQWCYHMRHLKGKKDKNGNLIHEINYGLTGLEDSVITRGRGADSLSKIRQILAQYVDGRKEDWDRLILAEYERFCKEEIGVDPGEFFVYLVKRLGLKVH